MSDYICDDRVDDRELAEKIASMTDEEFENYIKKSKGKE